MKTLTSHDDEFAQLDRLIKKAKPIENEAQDLHFVQQAIEAQAQQDDDDLQSAKLVFAKWTALHKYFHARPMRLLKGLSRPAQWQLLMDKYAHLGDGELSAWLGLQVEIAQNLDNGISDLRERRDGPCFLILLEYIGNRKRTALAVLHWAKAQSEE